MRSTIVACLVVVGCGDGLRESPEGEYRSTLHAFTFDGDGTFEYESLDRALWLAGSWTSTLEVEQDHENRGHVDLVIEDIEVDGAASDQANDSSGGVVYRVDEANVGWWFHQPDRAAQEDEMIVEHNRAGEARAPSSASFTSWSGNAQ